jgi:hypothetical protein
MTGKAKDSGISLVTGHCRSPVKAILFGCIFINRENIAVLRHLNY